MLKIAIIKGSLTSYPGQKKKGYGYDDDDDDGHDDDDDKNGETLHLNSKHQPSCLVKQTIF